MENKKLNNAKTTAQIIVLLWIIVLAVILFGFKPAPECWKYVRKGKDWVAVAKAENHGYSKMYDLRKNKVIDSTGTKEISADTIILCGAPMHIR